MKRQDSSTFLNRRNFLKHLTMMAGAGLLLGSEENAQAAATAAYASQGFLLGLNYPWIAYGMDFGKSAWGHAGIITSGWTYQTYTDSQGFTDTRLTSEKAHTGKGSLWITADLAAQDAHRKAGEVFVDLTYHAPPGVTAPLNLTGKTSRCWLYLPPGSAGNPSTPNGVQLFFKSKPENSNTLYSWYNPWINLQSEWEGSFHEFTANLAGSAAYADPQFSASRVTIIGVKVAMNSSATGALQGIFYLDDYQVDGISGMRFDFEQSEWEWDLSNLSCTTSALRVFVMCDGRSAPEFTPTGAVVSGSSAFDNVFFDDLDALISTAERKKFKIIPVLLDFTWCNSAQMLSGVQMGGHSAVIRDPALRQSFLDNALSPLIQRYKNSPQILAWEIMNEPEWAITELAPNSEVGDKVTLAQMQSFVKACTDRIHAINPALLVTVGSARRKWLEHWKTAGLDLYQFHWYEQHLDEETFPWLPYSNLGLDKPCFIGEVPTGGNTRPIAEYIKAARDGGYHGLMAWSYQAGDGASNYSAIKEPVGRWCTSLPLLTK